jgi:hypothetical protein
VSPLIYHLSFMLELILTKEVLSSTKNQRLGLELKSRVLKTDD